MISTEEITDEKALLTEEWKGKFLAYRTNAPQSIRNVNDVMMKKWSGRYEELFAKLIKKYGPVGQPKVPISAATGTASAGASNN
jgi:hypothetical protein